MKRVFFLFSLAVTAAGVASALAFAPARPDPAPTATAATTRSVAPVASRLPAASEPLAVTPAKATLEIHQAPVPILMKARPPVDLPSFDADAVGLGASAEAGDVSGESAAKAAIEADGYKGVKGLRQGEKGLWHATALRGTTPVPLTVDAEGRVSTE